MFEALATCLYASSVGGVIGFPGQANYATANACLMALSFHRCTDHSNAFAISWGVVGQVGMVTQMTDTSATQTSNFDFLSVVQVRLAFGCYAAGRLLEPLVLVSRERGVLEPSILVARSPPEAEQMQ